MNRRALPMKNRLMKIKLSFEWLCLMLKETISKQLLPLFSNSKIKVIRETSLPWFISTKKIRNFKIIDLLLKSGANPHISDIKLNEIKNLADKNKNPLGYEKFERVLNCWTRTEVSHKFQYIYNVQRWNKIRRSLRQWVVAKFWFQVFSISILIEWPDVYLLGLDEMIFYWKTTNRKRIVFTSLLCIAYHKWV